MNDILFLGIILSLIFAEFTDLSPGGIIVPAYFAMYAYDWKRLAGTVILSLLCVAVLRLFSKYMILYGRRRYAVYLMTGILLKYAAGLIGGGALVSIGSLIPGILGARDGTPENCSDADLPGPRHPVHPPRLHTCEVSL